MVGPDIVKKLEQTDDKGDVGKYRPQLRSNGDFQNWGHLGANDEVRFLQNSGGLVVTLVQ
jgi:hypothetical protein